MLAGVRSKASMPAVTGPGTLFRGEEAFMIEARGPVKRYGSLALHDA